MAPKRIWKTVSFEEIDEKLKRGLCFLCDEPFTVEHELIHKAVVWIKEEPEPSEPSNLSNTASPISTSHQGTTSDSDRISTPLLCDPMEDPPEDDLTVVVDLVPEIIQVPISAEVLPPYHDIHSVTLVTPHLLSDCYETQKVHGGPLKSATSSVVVDPVPEFNKAKVRHSQPFDPGKQQRKPISTSKNPPDISFSNHCQTLKDEPTPHLWDAAKFPGLQSFFNFISIESRRFYLPPKPPGWDSALWPSLNLPQFSWDLCEGRREPLKSWVLRSGSSIIRHSPIPSPPPEPPDRIAALSPSHNWVLSLTTAEQLSTIQCLGTVPFTSILVAFQVFDQMPRCLVVVWVTLILEYTKSGSDITTFDVFKVKQNGGITLANYIEMNMCLWTLLNYGVHDSSLGNSLVTMSCYYDCAFDDYDGFVEVSNPIITQYSSKLAVAEIGSYEFMLGFCYSNGIVNISDSGLLVKCCVADYTQLNGYEAVAFDLFKSMNMTDVSPGKNTLFSSCVSYTDIALSNVVSGNTYTEFSYQLGVGFANDNTTKIGVYVGKGWPEAGFERVCLNCRDGDYFQRGVNVIAFIYLPQDHDVVLWSAMIACLDQLWLSKDAAMLFYLMRNTCEIVFSATAELDDLHCGKNTHAYIFIYGFKSETSASNPLIKMHMKHGCVHDGATCLCSNWGVQGGLLRQAGTEKMDHGFDSWKGFKHVQELEGPSNTENTTELVSFDNGGTNNSNVSYSAEIPSPNSVIPAYGKSGKQWTTYLPKPFHNYIEYLSESSTYLPNTSTTTEYLLGSSYLPFSSISYINSRHFFYNYAGKYFAFVAVFHRKMIYKGMVLASRVLLKWKTLPLKHGTWKYSSLRTRMFERGSIVTG